MVDGQQDEEKASGGDETYWDKHGKSIVVKVGVALFILWLLHPLIVAVLLYASGEEVNLANQGTLGDSYGGLNALFSGAAMIAAITAVLIQTFEFRAQREELTLSREQLKNQLVEMQQQREEMEVANKTNADRLKFDRDVHRFNRSVRFQELVNEYADPESEVRKGIRMFSRWSKVEEFPYSEVALYTVSPKHWQEFESKNRLPNRRMNDKLQKMGEYRQQATDVLWLMVYLQRLELLGPAASELTIWGAILESHHAEILLFATGASEVVDVPPLWPASVIQLCHRYEILEQSQSEVA